MNSKNLLKLLYCRQFVLSPRKIDSFPFLNWTYTSISDSYHIYSHSYLPVTQVKKSEIQLTLLGYIIDPKEPYRSDKEILKSLLENTISIEDILIAQEALGGRYIIIIKTSNDIVLFNDACGLRQVYYFIDSGRQIWCCSQPNLLSELMELEPDDFVINNLVKKVFIKQKEYFWPGTLSGYSGLKKLLPNHFLNLENGEVVRFFPREPIVEIGLQDGVFKASAFLKNIMESANARFPLALPLTSGIDSRTILAACKEFNEEIFYYTLLYPPNRLKSPDLTIPKKILNKLGLRHNIIDCRKPMEEEFANIYNRNVSYAHSYWGDIAFGMYNKYPSNRICIKGNCSEITRCYNISLGSEAETYYEDKSSNLKKSLSIYLSKLHWNKNYFSIKVISEWLEDAKKIESDFNLHLLDLFYWEHDSGNWQAMSQLEWDLVQEDFTPFNNRALLLLLLSVNYKYRIKPDFRLHKEIIKNLWPELLNYPINPSAPFIKILKRMLKR